MWCSPSGISMRLANPIDEGTEGTACADELAEARQPGVEQRVAVAHREGKEQARQRHRDRHEAPTAEEAEIRRQLDGVVPVEEPRGEQAHHDPGEHAVVDLRLLAGLVDLARQHDRRHGLEHGLHHQVADDRRQRGGPVRLLSEPDGHADGEEQGQVGEDGIAGCAHGVEERSDDRGLDPAEQVVLAQAQQDPRGGQHGDRQHEALAQSLQLGEARNAEP